MTVTWGCEFVRDDVARVKLTTGRIDDFSCQAGKSQSFLWHTTVPQLAIRATANGAKSFIFQSKLDGKSIRITIGARSTWTIDAAEGEARRLQILIDGGEDPRQVKADATAAIKSEIAMKAAAFARDTLTVGDAWAVYIKDRRGDWGDRHYADHLAKAQAGGKQSKRGTRGRGKTIAGPLHSLMALRLCDLDAAAVEAWAAEQAHSRPTSARLAWRMLKAFLSWCIEHPTYASYLPATNPAKSSKSRKAFGKPSVKVDVLLREQLPAWFAAVKKIQNPVISAALQVMLLTGARPGEVLAIRWEDMNTKWNGLQIRDKVEGMREIPLTPYVWHLLAPLPRRSEYVFSAAPSKPIEPGEPNKPAKTVSSPNHQLSSACAVAGIDGLTLHGLRRSFKSLTEWLDIPAGVVAQLMGHKPSATAEKHYTIRPLDLLRIHHEKIEAWVLEQAKIDFAPDQPALKVVTVA